MPSRFTASSAGSQNSTISQLAIPPSRDSALLRISRYFIAFSLALFVLVSCTPLIESAVVPAASIPTSRPAYLSLSAEQNVRYRASLIRDNLPAYLDFLGNEVLPVMSKNIDEILHNTKGLTDLRPGFFYHGHIDYSIYASDEIDGLMEMNHAILQYHTLENPLIYIPYWREELGSYHDQNINAWLERINKYNRAISTPSAASTIQYTPLTEYEAVEIASSWDGYRRQNKLASPGMEMLTNMIYLIDGGKQPRYQESFRNINSFHSIAFLPEGYLQLDNKTHLESTFSPFQINFEYRSECQELLLVFEQASAAEPGYILNRNNIYVVQHPELMDNPDMTKLSMQLDHAIRSLPDDNLIKISARPNDQPIAFFATGNYIFVVFGSLDSPQIFK